MDTAIGRCVLSPVVATLVTGSAVRIIEATAAAGRYGGGGIGSLVEGHAGRCPVGEFRRFDGDLGSRRRDCAARVRGVWLGGRDAAVVGVGSQLGSGAAAMADMVPAGWSQTPASGEPVPLDYGPNDANVAAGDAEKPPVHAAMPRAGCATRLHRHAGATSS
jgi:hypothetical protein